MAITRVMSFCAMRMEKLGTSRMDSNTTCRHGVCMGRIDTRACVTCVRAGLTRGHVSRVTRSGPGDKGPGAQVRRGAHRPQVRIRASVTLLYLTDLYVVHDDHGDAAVQYGVLQAGRPTVACHSAHRQIQSGAGRQQALPPNAMLHGTVLAFRVRHRAQHM
jgi:hypothetical protein